MQIRDVCCSSLVLGHWACRIAGHLILSLLFDTETNLLGHLKGGRHTDPPTDKFSYVPRLLSGRVHPQNPDGDRNHPENCPRRKSQGLPKKAIDEILDSDNPKKLHRR